MRIAFCFYGQPRNYMKGYDNINTFILNQENLSVDFFFHAWILNKDMLYPTSPWRNIPIETLLYNENTVNDLINLYKPVLCEVEEQIQTFDENIYANTIAYNNIVCSSKRNNINNTLSQMYSRNKVRNLVNRYIHTSQTIYDTIIICRFDYSDKIELQLHNLDLSYTYVSDFHYPRKITPDNFIITPPSIFFEWFNIFENLYKVLNNNDLNILVKNYNEELEINPEVLIFANYLYVNIEKFNKSNIDNIKYISQIKTGL